MPDRPVTYLIRYRSDKNVRPKQRRRADGPQRRATGCHMDCSSIDVTGRAAEGGKAAIHARSQFRTLDSGVWVKKHGDKEPARKFRKWTPRANNRVHHFARRSRRKMTAGMPLSRAAAGLAAVDGPLCDGLDAPFKWSEARRKMEV